MQNNVSWVQHGFLEMYCGFIKVVFSDMWGAKRAPKKSDYFQVENYLMDCNHRVQLEKRQLAYCLVLYSNYYTHTHTTPPSFG